MKRVYISGPMKGKPDLNRPAFSAAARHLRIEGHFVYNPAAADLDGKPLREIMAEVLLQLCNCDAIAMLPGWWMSGGARVEWLLARYLGLKIIKV